MAISLGRVVGRRVFARSFPGGSRTYLTSVTQSNGAREELLDLGRWILATVGGGLGGYAYYTRRDAAEDSAVAADRASFEARLRQEAEARAIRFEELKAKCEAQNINVEEILSRVDGRAK